MAPRWVDELERLAPDAVGVWRAFDAREPIRLRRELRHRVAEGSTDLIVAQLDCLADALAARLKVLPPHAFGLPGGEADWTVAEAVGHDIDARVGLAKAAELAAAGRFPVDAPAVVPGVPGPKEAGPDELLARLDRSRDVIARSARHLHGHELDPCPLVHPWIGRLRCGEWLLFVGVHDVMHLEQLHGLAEALER